MLYTLTKPSVEEKHNNMATELIFLTVVTADLDLMDYSRQQVS